MSAASGVHCWDSRFACAHASRPSHCLSPVQHVGAPRRAHTRLRGSPFVAWARSRGLCAASSRRRVKFIYIFTPLAPRPCGLAGGRPAGGRCGRVTHGSRRRAPLLFLYILFIYQRVMRTMILTQAPRAHLVIVVRFHFGLPHSLHTASETDTRHVNT